MRFLKTAVACIALTLQSYGYAATENVLPGDQATSCNDVFRCGTPHLGPGLGMVLHESVEQRAAIEFPIAGIKDLTSASLILNASIGGGYPTLQGVPVIEFYGYRGDGVISYSDVSSGSLLFSKAFPFDGPYSFDVTRFVAGALDSGWSHVGFSLRDVAFGSSLASVSNSLTVTAAVIPEPEIYMMLMAGLALLRFATFSRNKEARKGMKTEEVRRENPWL